MELSRARAPPSDAEEVRRLAVEVFRIVGCSGMARVDFFVEPADRVLVNELNSIPGFTATSVYAKLSRPAASPIRSCSTGCCGWRSSATRTSAATGTE